MDDRRIFVATWRCRAVRDKNLQFYSYRIYRCSNILLNRMWNRIAAMINIVTRLSFRFPFLEPYTDEPFYIYMRTLQPRGNRESGLNSRHRMNLRRYHRKIAFHSPTKGKGMKLPLITFYRSLRYIYTSLQERNATRGPILNKSQFVRKWLSPNENLPVCAVLFIISLRAFVLV